MNLSMSELRELILGQAPPASTQGEPTSVQDYARKNHPYTLGANYFIRSALYHYTGKLVAVFDQELVLEGAAWIADDGRFSDAVAKGAFNEIEPYPDGKLVVIGRASIQDAVVVDFPVPRSQK